MTDTLTFGVELEFIAVFPEYAFTNRYPELVPDDREGYRKGHVSAVRAICHWLKAYSISVNHDEVFAATRSDDSWYIQTEGVHLTPAETNQLPSGYIQEGVEISSRVLRYAEDWQAELNKLLQALHHMRQHFGCEFLTNSSTGLHVHIGNNPTHSLTPVKNLLQVATAHERNLDQIHDENRILDILPTPLVDTENDYPPPLYAPLSFFHASCEEEIPSILHAIHDVETRKDMTDLSKIFRPTQRGTKLFGKSCTLNLDNLIWSGIYDDNPTNTIEFRQHAGDLDLTEISMYVKLLAGLIDFCTWATDEDVINLIANGVNTNFGLRDFLEAILVPEMDSVVDYFCNRPALHYVSTDNATLQPMVDVNNQETAVRRSLAAVEAAIAAKRRSGVYGMGFEGGPGDVIPLSRSAIRWMLECAKKDIQATEEDVEADDLVSRARQETLRKLATIYIGLDDTGNFDQEIMREELRDWVLAYGDIPSEDEDEMDEDEDEMDEDDDEVDEDGDEMEE